MKKLIALSLILGFLAFQGTLAAEKKPIDYPVKELYSEPSHNSLLVYKIPIEVKLLDVSKDADWYKVEIKFNLGPISYKHVGWAPIPVGTILAEREAAEIASILEK